MVIFGWLCLFGFIGFTIYYVYSQRAAVRCQSIVVKIDPNSPRFMDEDEIVSLIEKSGEPVIGHKLSAININSLESRLTFSKTLYNVEIFRKIESKGISFKGMLIVSLSERTPVLRIKNMSTDYYLDSEGVEVPVSAKYLDRILIATGTVPNDPEIKKNLLQMAEFVNKNEFWRAQIEQVFIQVNGELLMVPHVGDYLIDFGTPEDYELKFRNLKAVYQQGFKNMGWNKYKTISVKYRNQVVCTKK